MGGCSLVEAGRCDGRRGPLTPSPPQGGPVTLPPGGSGTVCSARCTPSPACRAARCACRVHSRNRCAKGRGAAAVLWGRARRVAAPGSWCSAALRTTTLAPRVSPSLRERLNGRSAPSRAVMGVVVLSLGCVMGCLCLLAGWPGGFVSGPVVWRAYLNRCQGIPLRGCGGVSPVPKIAPVMHTGRAERAAHPSLPSPPCVAPEGTRFHPSPVPGRSPGTGETAGGRARLAPAGGRGPAPGRGRTAPEGGRSSAA